jgi:O-methyltransferase involved in polyketide biosynthesis
VSSSESISPTAHYTGYVWARNGLSHRDLASVEGRFLYESLRVPMAVNRALGGGTLEAYLLARHRAIDALLERAIERRGVTQVIEVACGLSPRGWRFTRRYPDRLTYVEADLPAMAQRKRAALQRMGSLSERHQVAEVDALRDQGPGSLVELTATLEERQGLAIVTEGLLGYLPRVAVDGIWRRVARALAGFASGFYASDLHLGVVQNLQVRAFRVLLSAFVRGRVHLHFDSAADATRALEAAGFHSAAIHRAVELIGPGNDPAADLSHILEASTT